MADPAPKTGPWPLLAIVGLVVLLSAFLVVRFRKEQEPPPLVKDPSSAPVPTGVPEARPPAPTPPPVPEPPPSSAPVPSGASEGKPASAAAPPSPSAVDPGVKELESLQETARKALEAGNWKAAEAALEKAAKISADAVRSLREQLDAGRRKEEEARRAEEAAREARRKQDEAFAAVRAEVEKASSENRWDAATALLEKLAKEFPGIERDEEYRKEAGRIREFRRDCDAVFVKAMADAERLFREGKYAQSASTAEKSLLSYPERRPRVDEFQKKVRQARSEAEMIRIPSALCWIGSDESPDERPRRQVKLPAFFIDRVEVTNEDFQAFILSTGREPPAGWAGRTPPRGRERHPVVYVTYEDARAYADWAGKRLPTAEEWEVAARGPDGREYPWGSALAETENVFPANCLEYWQVNKTQAPGTWPVDAPAGANGESAFRVHGMGGNVWEWTSTAARAGEKGPECRVVKGGSFMTSAKALRCANVLLEDPRLSHPDLGFRCVRDAQ